MASTDTTSKIRLRRDTAANWKVVNPILDLGEPGVEIDTRKVKYGDAETNWNSLPYASEPYDEAWTIFSSVIGSNSGKITTASADFRYKKIGKSLLWKSEIAITTNGTGGAAVTITLPFIAQGTAKNRWPLYGREDARVGFMLQGKIEGGSNLAQILKYDNAYPGGDGYALYVSGIYEIGPNQ